MGKDLNGKELGANLTQRKDGMYRRSYYLNGKKRYVCAKSLKEVKAKYKKVEREIENGFMAEEYNPTLDDFAEKFFSKLKDTDSIKPSSLYNYKIKYKRISKEYGRLRLKNITPIKVRALQEMLSEKYAPKTVNDYTGLLAMMLGYAYKLDIIPKNPCDVLTPIKKKAENERTNARALNDEELQLFIKYAEGQYYYNAIRLLFATGMRSGELRGLKWSDYDIKNNVLHIRRTASVDENNKLVMNTPKTKHGERDYPVNNQIKSILLDARKQYETMNGAISLDDYIFKSTENKVLSRNVFKKAFDTICSAIVKDGHEFERISPHAARHTFITNMYYKGINDQVIKNLVGHSPSAKVTTDVYMGRKQSEVEKAMMSFEIAM